MESKPGDVCIILADDADADAGGEASTVAGQLGSVNRSRPSNIELNELLVAKIRDLQADAANAEQASALEHLLPLALTSLVCLRDSQEPNAKKARKDARSVFLTPKATEYDFNCYRSVERIIDRLMDAVVPLIADNATGGVCIANSTPTTRSTYRCSSPPQPVSLSDDTPTTSRSAVAQRVDPWVITIDDDDLPAGANDELEILSAEIISPRTPAARRSGPFGGRRSDWMAKLLDFSNEEQQVDVDAPSAGRDHGRRQSRKRRWQAESEGRTARHHPSKRSRHHYRNSRDSTGNERQQSTARDESELSRVEREEYRTNSGTSLAGFPSSSSRAGNSSQGTSMSLTSGNASKMPDDGHDDHRPAPVMDPAEANADTRPDDEAMVLNGGVTEENVELPANTEALGPETESPEVDEHPDEQGTSSKKGNVEEHDAGEKAFARRPDPEILPTTTNSSTDQEVPAPNGDNEENQYVQPASQPDERLETSADMNESWTSPSQTRRVSISLETSSIVFEIEEGNEVGAFIGVLQRRVDNRDDPTNFEIQLKPLNEDEEDAEEGNGISAENQREPVPLIKTFAQKLPYGSDGNKAAVAKRYIGNHLKWLLSTAATARLQMRHPALSRWIVTDSVLGRLNEKLLSNTFVTHLPEPLLPEWLLDYGLCSAGVERKFELECSYFFLAFGWDSWQVRREQGAATASGLEFVDRLIRWFMDRCSANDKRQGVVERKKWVETHEVPARTVGLDLKYGLAPPIFVLVTMPEIGEEALLRQDYNRILREKAGALRSFDVMAMPAWTLLSTSDTHFRQSSLGAMVEVLDWAKLVGEGTTGEQRSELGALVKVLVEELRLSYGVLTR